MYLSISLLTHYLTYFLTLILTDFRCLPWVQTELIKGRGVGEGMGVVETLTVGVVWPHGDYLWGGEREGGKHYRHEHQTEHDTTHTGEGLRGEGHYVGGAEAL